MKTRAAENWRGVSKQIWIAILLVSVWISFLVNTVLAADPAWWAARGAVTGNANPNAVVNQGQLKQFTVKAVRELNAKLAGSGGAGTTLNNLVAGWQQDYATNHYATDPNNPSRPYKPADFRAVTVGQLKYIAGLFRVLFQTAGYNYYSPPWIRADAVTDNTLAVAGQLKTVFDFDLSVDGNGLLSQWEISYFGHVGLDPNSIPDGDGMTLLQKYQQGIAPGKKDNPAVKLQVNVIVR